MQINKHFKGKLAEMAVSAGIKIIISVLCGALLLTGGYGVIKGVVLPNTKTRTKALADYHGEGGAGGGSIGDYAIYGEGFEDGPCQTTYYSTLTKAMTDLNAGTNTGADATEATAAASLSVRDKDGAVIVKVLKDTSGETLPNVTNDCIFDLNGKIIDLPDQTLTFDGNTTFRDSVGTGVMKKLTNTNTNTMIIANGNKVVFENGTYEARGNNTAITQCIRYSGTGDMTINNGTFKAYNTAAARVRTIAINSGNSATFNNGEFYAENSSANGASATATWGCQDIYFGADAKDATFNGGKFKANSLCQGIVTCVSFGKNTSAVINNGTFYSENNLDPAVTDTTGRISVALYGPCKQIVINNADVTAVSTNGETGYGVTVAGNNTINGGVFKGLNVAVVPGTVGGVFGDTIVNGGSFYGVVHGGFYFQGNSSSKIQIRNATIGNTSNWTDLDVSGRSRHGHFYIGTPKDETYVYMNNCKIDRSEMKNIPVTLSSNYNYKNTYLYVSNTDLGPVRVDGPNAAGDQGHLYIGKNVTYSLASGANGRGIVDTTTYANQVFCK